MRFFGPRSDSEPATHLDDNTDARAPLRRVLDAVARRLTASASLFLGDDTKVEDKGAISTGSFAFDHATGCNGWPRGRVSELVGPPGCGKSTVALAAIREAQRNHGLAAWIDVEHSFQRDYAARCGVDLSRLLIIRPSSGEDALEATDQLLQSNDVDIVVVDSVAALAPKSELDGAQEAPVNALARLMSARLRSLHARLGASNVALLMTNQLRTHPLEEGGSVEVSAGGDALKYYAALRVDVRRDCIRYARSAEDPSRRGRAIAQRSTLRITKNKLGAPHGETSVELNFSRGLDRGVERLEHAVASGLVVRDGRRYFLDDRPLGGRAEAAALLREDAGLATHIEESVCARWNSTSRENQAEPGPRMPPKDTTPTAVEDTGLKLVA